MAHNIFEIYKKYFDENTFDRNLQQLNLFATNNNISKLKKNLILSKTFNGLFKTKLNEHKYEINFYDIVETKKTIIMFGYNSDPDKYCISVKIDNSEPEILTIITVESLSQCYATNDKSDLNMKKGSILMQIIIKWAKKIIIKKFI